MTFSASRLPTWRATTAQDPATWRRRRRPLRGMGGCHEGAPGQQRAPGSWLLAGSPVRAGPTRVGSGRFGGSAPATLAVHLGGKARTATGSRRVPLMRHRFAPYGRRRSDGARCSGSGRGRRLRRCGAVVGAGHPGGPGFGLGRGGGRVGLAACGRRTARPVRSRRRGLSPWWDALYRRPGLHQRAVDRDMRIGQRRDLPVRRARCARPGAQDRGHHRCRAVAVVGSRSRCFVKTVGLRPGASRVRGRDLSIGQISGRPSPQTALPTPGPANHRNIRL